MAMKQLKKNDFLNAITEEPMTRGELVEALEEYDFIDSYLDYLTDHFIARGRVIRNEDGTIQRKASRAAAAGPRIGYRVRQTEEGGFVLEKAEIKYLTDALKDQGWSLTESAAIKRATQKSFARYKEETAIIRRLIDTEPMQVELVGPVH